MGAIGVERHGLRQWIGDWALGDLVARFAPREATAFSWSTRRGRLRSFRFQLEEGTIALHLPAELQAGVASGTIERTARHESDPIVAAEQRARLGEYLISLGDRVVPAAVDAIEANLPAGTQGIGVARDWGRTLVRAPLFVHPNRPEPMSPSNGLLRHVRAGEPFAIAGPWFDGRAAGTKLHIGGLDLTPLAVTRGEALFVMPYDLYGLCSFALESPSGSMSGTVHCTRVTLELGKSDLAAGETTWLALRVEGASAEERVFVVNHAPQIVCLARGDQQSVMVRPGSTWLERVIGLRAGTFAIASTIADPDEGPSLTQQSGESKLVAGRVRIED